MTEADFLARVGEPTEAYARGIKAAGKVRLLCVHGRGDATIPYQESEECAELAGAELALVDGDHNWRRPADAEQMIAAVVEFAARPE
jgi:pimeloyl-ACP methyl ester carboxylesterase